MYVHIAIVYYTMPHVCMPSTPYLCMYAKRIQIATGSTQVTSLDVTPPRAGSGRQATSCLPAYVCMSSYHMYVANFQDL